MDETVDAFVGSGAREPAGGVAPAAVAHRFHEIQHDLFEERGRVVGDFVEQFGGEFVVERFVGPFEDGLGGFGGRLKRRLRLAACVVVGRAAVAKLPVGLEAVEEGDVDRGGVFREDGSTDIRDREHAAADAGDEPGPFEMDLGPAEAVHEPRLCAAGEQFRAVGVGQSEVIGDRAAEGGERPVVAVRDATQEREADLMELGDGHGG